MLNGKYYAKFQPDSGLTIPATQRILRNAPNVNPQSISVEDARAVFAKHSFTLSDLANVVTGELLDNSTFFIGNEVRLWIGRMTGSFAFSDYFELPKTLVKTVKFKNEDFAFTSQELPGTWQVPRFNTQDTLLADTVAGAGTLVATLDISGFPTTGEIFIKDEFVTYTSKVDGTKTFTLSGVTANDHSASDELFNVTTLTGNPLDLFLQILISDGGGGSFDVLSEGLGVNPADIDITAITSIRNDFFSGQTYTFKVFGVENILRFIEDELLITTNCRLTQSSRSLITLILLDKIEFGNASRTFDSSNIIRKSAGLQVNENTIRNVVIFKYDYDATTETYGSFIRTQDDASVAAFPEKKPFEIKSKGVTTANGGLNIAQDRSARWLNRLSTVAPKITLKTRISSMLAAVGERVLVDFNLPSEDGDRVYFSELEVSKRSISFKTQEVSFQLDTANYTGIRNMFTCPSDPIVTVNSQTSVNFTPGRATAEWTVGDKVRLWLGQTQEIEAVNTIATITSDTVTFTGAFVISLTTSHQIKFANYDEVTDRQKGYGFVAPNSGTFVSDSKPAYKVAFS